MGSVWKWKCRRKLWHITTSGKQCSRCVLWRRRSVWKWTLTGRRTRFQSYAGKPHANAISYTNLLRLSHLHQRPRQRPPPTQTPEGKYVESLRQSLVGDTLTATLTLSAPLETYNTMTLNGPNRVVFDLAGFSAQRLNASYTAGGNTQQIRTGEYDGARELYLMLQPYRDTMSRFRRINGW